jgi:hypothetical protein
MLGILETGRPFAPVTDLKENASGNAADCSKVLRARAVGIKEAAPVVRTASLVILLGSGTSGRDL